MAEEIQSKQPLPVTLLFMLGAIVIGILFIVVSLIGL